MSGRGEGEPELTQAGGTSANSLWPLTEKKASSKTSRGPEKPITSNGWAPTGRTARLDGRGHDELRHPDQVAASLPRQETAQGLVAGGGGEPCPPRSALAKPLLTQQPPKVMAGDRAAK